MWFHADRDPKVILKSVWTIARWLLFGPLVGGGLLALVGLLLVGWEGAVNGLFIGLAFGAVGGVMTAGSKALSQMD